MLLLLAVGFAGNAVAQDCTFRISGNVLVDTQLAGFSGEFPLHHVEVNVSGKSGTYTTWGSWGSKYTDKDGRFEITEDLSGDACTNGRHVKVEVRFKDDDLEIRKEAVGSPDWYLVGMREKGDCQTCEFGNLVFKTSGNYDRSDAIARKHADIWWLYDQTMNYLAGLGSDSVYGFPDKVNVVYPHNIFFTKSEASYVSPVSGLVHIYAGTNPEGDYEDNFDDPQSALLHELGHAWAFQRSLNNAAMRNYFLGHGFETHGIVERELVGFHEGFAQFFGTRIYEVLRSEQPTSPRPYAKPYLWDGGIRSNEAACEHGKTGSIDCSDIGWEAIFNGLVMLEGGRDPIDYDYATASSPNILLSNVDDESQCEIPRPETTFQEVLRSFTARSSVGYDENIHTDEMNLNSYLDRLAAISGSLNSQQIRAFKALVDPSDDGTAIDDYCGSLWIDLPEVDDGYTRDGDFDGLLMVTVENDSSDLDSFASTLVGSSDDRSFEDSMSIVALEPSERLTFEFPISIEPALNGSFPLTRLEWAIPPADDRRSVSLELGADYKVSGEARSGLSRTSLDASVAALHEAIIECTVENVGNTHAGIESVLAVYQANNRIGTAWIPNLVPGEAFSQTFRDSWIGGDSSIDDRLYSCVADDEDAIEESSETNNSDGLWTPLPEYEVIDTTAVIESWVEDSIEFQEIQHALREAGLLDVAFSVEQIQTLIEAIDRLLQDVVIWETRGRWSNEEELMRYMETTVFQRQVMQLQDLQLTQPNDFPELVFQQTN